MSKPTIEQLLSEMMTEPTPDNRFVAELERTLLATQLTLWGQIQRKLFPPRRRIATVAFVILLALLIPIAVIGPQTVVAEIQQLFGFVPGVGFADLDDTRILQQPIQHTRNGVTLIVTQVLADADGTTVVLATENLPSVTSEDVLPIEDGLPFLRLADGTELSVTDFGMSYGFGTFEYAALPVNVDRFDLIVPRLPRVPNDLAPRDWVMPIQIETATADGFNELYATPYQPIADAVRDGNVQIQLLQASHSTEMTVVLLEMQLLGEAAQQVEPYSFRTAFHNLYLTDERGRRYDATLMPNSAAAVQVVPGENNLPPTDTIQLEVTFPAEARSAETLTLHLQEVMYALPVQGSFTVDLGDAPQIGDQFAVVETFTLLGTPITITHGRIEARDGICPTEPCVPDTFIILTVDSASIDERRHLAMVTAFDSEHQFSGQMGFSIMPQPEMRFSLDDSGSLPAGEVTFYVQSITLLEQGDWQISWQLP